MFKSKVLKIRYILAIFAISILTSCGGGGGSSSDSTPAAPTNPETPSGGGGDTPATTDNMISGVVVKGPVNDAQIIIFGFDGVTEIGRGETASDGSYTISIGDNTGGIVVSVSGGTYTDEATGANSIQLGSTPMRAAFMIPEATAEPFDTNINVTPFSELAVRKSLVDGVLDAQKLIEENADFLGFGGGSALDILNTIPSNPLTDSLNNGTAEDLFGVLLSAVSQIMASNGLADWSEVVDLLDAGDADGSALVAITTALTTLGNSDSAAGENISLIAVAGIIASAVGTDDNPGDDNSGGDDNSDGDDNPGDDNSGVATLCLTGSSIEITLPEGLAGVTGDLTASTVVDTSLPFAQGSVSNFAFSNSGTLSIDNESVSETPYHCGNTDLIYWFESTADRLYELSFTEENKFNEINLSDDGGVFQAQWTDVNGDFANVTNGEVDSGDTDTDAETPTDDTETPSGNFNLSITGESTESGVVTTFQEIELNNVVAPDPDDESSDFKGLIEDNTDLIVDGANDDITVRVTNNNSARVTFKLVFQVISGGNTIDYDLLYDYTL